jgi:hypothetical protein
MKDCNKACSLRNKQNHTLVDRHNKLLLDSKNSQNILNKKELKMHSIKLDAFPLKSNTQILNIDSIENKTFQSGSGNNTKSLNYASKFVFEKQRKNSNIENDKKAYQNFVKKSQQDNKSLASPLIKPSGISITPEVIGKPPVYPRSSRTCSYYVLKTLEDASSSVQVLS